MVHHFLSNILSRYSRSVTSTGNLALKNYQVWSSDPAFDSSPSTDWGRCHFWVSCEKKNHIATRIGSIAQRRVCNYNALFRVPGFVFYWESGCVFRVWDRAYDYLPNSSWRFSLLQLPGVILKWCTTKREGREGGRGRRGETEKVTLVIGNCLGRNHLHSFVCVCH